MANKVKRNVAKKTKYIPHNLWPLARCEKKGEIIISKGIDGWVMSENEAIDYILQMSEAIMKSHRMIE